MLAFASTTVKWLTFETNWIPNSMNPLPCVPLLGGRNPKLASSGILPIKVKWLRLYICYIILVEEHFRLPVLLSIVLKVHTSSLVSGSIAAKIRTAYSSISTVSTK